MSARARWIAMLACFLGSGFAGLLYQIAWTRELDAVFGTSELAVASVLAAYMGGLAIGAALAARAVGRVRRPLRAYALLELGVAVSAIAVPIAIAAASRLEIAVLGGRGAGGTASALFHLVCSLAILGVPTAFMGATLPLLVRAAVRGDREVGWRVGALYAANTAGAIGGAIAAGFLLLPALGLRDTVWIGAAVNASACALALVLGRGEILALPPVDGATAKAVRGPSWVLPLVLASGAASFAYEVLWTRLLAQVLGSSVYAFSTMLASVLLGIAVGGALAARFAGDAARAARRLAAAELATAALAWAAFRAVDRVPALAQRLDAGASAALGANAALALAILLPPSIAIGASFPFAVRAFTRDAVDAGRASARVSAWNTAGAIAGSLATGFALLPLVGFAGTLRCAAALNLALAAAAAWLAPRRAPVLFTAAALGAGALLVAPPSEPWQLLRASPLSLEPLRGELSYFGVGRAATVMMLRSDGRLQLRSDGLPESAIALRGSRAQADPLAAWLGALPSMARPDLRRLLVIGLGGGTALEAVPASVGTIDVIELEPQVAAADRAVAPLRRADPLADPRVSLEIDDARSALRLGEGRYDAIVSQPSHPWNAGASHLYTREFFERVRARLAPDGVFVQWIGLAFVDEDLLRSLLATLLAVFPHVEVYRPAAWGVLLLASPAPLAVAEALPAALAAAPRDLEAIGVVGPEDVAAALSLDEAGARSLAERGVVSTDDRNRLAMRSPRVLGRTLGAQGADALFADLDPLQPPPAGLDATYLVRRLASLGQRARAERVARAIPDPAERALARGALALQQGDRDGARRFAEEALGVGGDPERAREIALLAAGEAELPGGSLAESAGGVEVLRQARRLETEGAWESLRGLDARLAAVPPRSLLAPEAARLRGRWRLAIGGPDGAREGLAILDPMLARIATREALALRADLAAAAGDLGGALATWMELAARSPRPARQTLAHSAIERLQSGDADALSAGERAAWIADWEAQLNRH